MTKIRTALLVATATACCLVQPSSAFHSSPGTTLAQQPAHRTSTGRQLPIVNTRCADSSSSTVLAAGSNDAAADMASPVEEYKNAPTKILSNFMSKPAGDDEDAANPLDSIDFAAPKFREKVDLATLAAILDCELYNREWFVTGNVNPIYFSDAFEFQDPDVKVSGIEDYARGVYKLFDQECSRAEIISTVVNPDAGPSVITCTWRLSGKVSIGPRGLPIKPYVCYTDFTVDEATGLIVMQEDRFDVPQWDILLSALFPFLVGIVTAPPAPPVEPRVVEMPSLRRGGDGGSPLDKLLQMFGGN